MIRGSASSTVGNTTASTRVSGSGSSSVDSTGVNRPVLRSTFGGNYRRDSDTVLRRESFDKSDNKPNNLNKETANPLTNGDAINKGSERTYSSQSKYVPYSQRYQQQQQSNISPVSTTVIAGNSTNADNGVPPQLSAKSAFFKGGDTSYTPKFDPSSVLKSGSTAQSQSREVVNDNKERTEKEDSRPERTTNKENATKLDGYVGFANLPNQVYRKSVKRGFEFNLMVVGESGLGKSTLINSLFLTDLYNTEHPGPSLRIKKTVNVETTKVLLKENGVCLSLTIVDTPGFGDAVDNSNCWQPIIDNINSKYEEYLNAESRVNRKLMPDPRIHCCLYFIAPSGHGLKPLDVEFMKRLHDKVNIVPLIAKSDTMTPDECREFKKTILNEIAQHKIKIYEFPDCDDEEENKIQKALKTRVPFAVIGSNTVTDLGGRKIRGRVYPWGVVEVENLEHNDFIALRNMVIRTHMQDLKDVTNNVHYENFRYNKLAGPSEDGKMKPTNTTKSPILQMEEEKKEHDAKLKKMEAEMEQVFEMKVKEKQQKLKDSEADLQRRAEQMKKSLEQQEKELEEKRQQFEKEKQMWDETQRLDDQRRRSLENSKDSIDKDKQKKKKGIF
ncbi:septin-7-like [Tubulanus polymorphus]|uniref:septin-7-like n=1 Tax=Tubulanus polymorphus TaxID=672921 RepID=UPI003DA3CC13